MNTLWFIPLLVLLYLAVLTGVIVWQLGLARRLDTLQTPQNRLLGSGRTFEQTRQEQAFTITHTVEDGIERVTCTPRQRRHTTPILMAHGMWHAAWCWQPWQELFAEWGWESTAYSLPGHGKSPAQRPVWLCTLDYYLAFLRDEVQRLPVKPILMGHSMGGALIQWYIKHVADDLPAAVLAVPWTSHNAFRDSLPLFFRLDIPGCLLAALTWDARPFVRSPKRAAAALITEGARMPPEELHARLETESALVMLQHNPPYWSPPESVCTPMLVLAGEKDALVGAEPLRRSAAFYRAEYILVEDAGHNLMMEKNSRQTAEAVRGWLEENVN
jgi:pimeloyl-ACP methyl ester carboxylesterase